VQWNPNKYLLFKDKRAEPFNDLLQHIRAKNNLKVIDLGCGTGEITKRLSLYLPASDVLGIDSSREMMDIAQKYSNEKLIFKCMSIEEFIKSKSKWDLVFSHAALSWVDNHNELIPRLLSFVNKKGQIALQIPSNHSHFTFTYIKETAEEPAFSEALNGWTRCVHTLQIDEYARILCENGCSNIIAYEKVYIHLMNNVDQIVEWMSATSLIPYFERLPAKLHIPFLESYKNKLLRNWKEAPIIFPFKRMIIVADK